MNPVSNRLKREVITTEIRLGGYAYGTFSVL